MKMEKKPEGAPRSGTPPGYSNSLFVLQQPPQIQIVQQKAGADGADGSVHPAGQLQHGLLSPRQQIHVHPIGAEIDGMVFGQGVDFSQVMKLIVLSLIHI